MHKINMENAHVFHTCKVCGRKQKVSCDNCGSYNVTHQIIMYPEIDALDYYHCRHCGLDMPVLEWECTDANL